MVWHKEKQKGPADKKNNSSSRQMKIIHGMKP